MKNSNDEFYGSIDVAKRVGISLRQLYHWVNDFSIVQPDLSQHGSRKFRRFSLNDLKKISEVKRLRDGGYTLASAIKIIKGEQRAVNIFENKEQV